MDADNADELYPELGLNGLQRITRVLDYAMSSDTIGQAPGAALALLQLAQLVVLWWTVSFSLIISCMQYTNLASSIEFSHAP
jgi:hypothetical protein